MLCTYLALCRCPRCPSRRCPGSHQTPSPEPSSPSPAPRLSTPFSTISPPRVIPLTPPVAPHRPLHDAPTILSSGASQAVADLFFLTSRRARAPINIVVAFPVDPVNPSTNLSRHPVSNLPIYIFPHYISSFVHRSPRIRPSLPSLAAAHHLFFAPPPAIFVEHLHHRRTPHAMFYLCFSSLHQSSTTMSSSSKPILHRRLSRSPPVTAIDSRCRTRVTKTASTSSSYFGHPCAPP